MPKFVCACLGVLIAVVLSGCGKSFTPHPNAAPTPKPPKAPPPAPRVEVPAPPVETSPAQAVPVDAFELPPHHFWGGVANFGDLEVRAVNRFWAGPAPDMLPLAEAIDQGLCVITESGRHDAVLVSVNSKLPVFALAGDLLIGGRQDRFVANSSVIEPGSTILRVFCAEHGRWTPDGEDFVDTFICDPRRPQADLITKETIHAQAKQAEIDAAVAQITSYMNAPSYRQIFDTAQTDPITRMVRRADDVVSAFTVGFAVYRGKELIAVDIFHSTRLLQDVANRLLRSYAMTSIYGDVAHWKFDRKPEPQPASVPPTTERSEPENFEPPPPELPTITEDGLARFECRRRPDEHLIHTGIFRNRTGNTD